MSRTASRQPDLVEFTIDDRRPVVIVMRRLLQDRDGWINLQPQVEPEDVPTTGGLERLFSSRGPSVPLGSWVPGARRRKGGFEPVSLGLQHAGGPRALWALRDVGHPAPRDWKVLADHPRRGFVLAVPDDADTDATLAWLLQAAVILTPFTLPTAWYAGVFPAR